MAPASVEVRTRGAVAMGTLKPHAAPKRPLQMSMDLLAAAMTCAATPR